MKILFRLSLCASLFGGLIAGAGRACPNLTACLGLDLREFLDLQRRLEQEVRRGEHLERQSKTVFQRLEARYRVIETLHAGRIDLREAAARFRDLTPLVSEGYREIFRRVHGGRSDEERWCRQVIQYLRDGRPDHPGHAAQAQQLEAELQDYLDHGLLRLREAEAIE